ncbi:hypothetical protein [Cohnella cellulosilytica]|uniref:hypothetical protein n=1 Tax=Cohnella cellulosilytica TaxID=986710 RepID=UPI0036063E09
MSNYSHLAELITTVFSNILGNTVALSAVAALIAYYFWSVYNKPHLVLEEHQNMDLIMPQVHKENKRKHRIAVKNIGRVPASNCRAFFRLEGTFKPKDEPETRIYLNAPLAWYNKRGEIFGNQGADYTEERTLSPGELEYVDLFEQPEGNLRTYDWIDPSRKPILKVEAENGEFELDDIRESVLFRDTSNDLSEQDTSFEQSHLITYKELRNHDWTRSELVLITDEGGESVHKCDFNWTSGELKIRPIPKRGFNALRRVLRRLDSRIWN